MILTSITIENYRNIATAELYPGREMTVLYGRNGQGKTNLLEAVYLLGTGRPFRTAKVPDLIKQDTTSATIRGKLETAGVVGEIALQLTGKQRRVVVDGKSIQRPSELHGRLTAVVFAPDDTAMVKQGPEIRRRYLDRSLYSSTAGFLKDYHDYYRTLKQRNSLLRRQSSQGLDIWTEQLVEAGVKLMHHRQRYVERLQPLFQEHYSRIAGGSEQVELTYCPDIELSSRELNTKFTEKLEQCLATDIRYGVTSAGPHRDDLCFMISGRPLKVFGSQGQQRSFVLALKLAELDYLQQSFGEPPVMLLDDIASELDRERIHNLLSFLRQRKVQVLITTTTTVGIDPDMLQACSVYRVDAGTLTYEGTIAR